MSDPTIKANEDPQMAFDVAREYKEHVDSVKKDRQLEEWLEVGLIEPPVLCLFSPTRNIENITELRTMKDW